MSSVPPAPAGLPLEERYPAIELNAQETALLEIARRAADDSPDRSRKVGAVIVRDDGMIVTVGCNTPTHGVPHTDRYLERPAKYDWTEHAERNAIYEAASLGKATGGCSIVLPWFPCRECCRAIAQSGIKRVIAQYPDISDPTWGQGFIDGLEIFDLRGVVFTPYIDDAPMAAARADDDHAVTAQTDAPTARQMAQAWNEALAGQAEGVAVAKARKPGR